MVRSRGKKRISIKIPEGIIKEGSIRDVGTNADGMPMVVFTLVVYVKKNDRILPCYFNCYAEGQQAKELEEKKTYAVDGRIVPDIYKRASGRTLWKQQVYCDFIEKVEVEMTEIEKKNKQKEYQKKFKEKKKKEKVILPFE